MLGRLALAAMVAALLTWRLGLRWTDVSDAVADRPEFLAERGTTPSEGDRREPGAQTPSPTGRLLSAEELSHFDGSEGSRGLYLALLGRVFDVGAGGRGVRHYGPGGGYAFFSGRDASRAFVTGEFEGPGLTDDVAGLTPRQMLELQTWLEFYQKEYTPVGRVVGRFFDASGEPTEALRRAELVLEEGRREKREAERQNQRFPPCNSSWKKEEGTKLWCSQKSGGIVRDWAGLPRRYFVPGSDNWRCVCAHDRDLGDPHLRPFEGCGPRDAQCYTGKR